MLDLQSTAPSHQTQQEFCLQRSFLPEAHSCENALVELASRHTSVLPQTLPADLRSSQQRLGRWIEVDAPEKYAGLPVQTCMQGQHPSCSTLAVVASMCTTAQLPCTL